MMFQYKYLSNYLLEILTNKKHFNIVDKLQHANIKKREDNLKNLLKNNPFEMDKSIFEPFVKKDDKSSYIEVINSIQDNTFKEMMIEELNLLNDYKELWDKELVHEFKGLRGKGRDFKHIELFQRLFFDRLKIDEKKIKIDENLNLCYIEGQIEIATKLSDILESNIKVPIIALGGAGKLEDIKEVFEVTNVDAVSCGSMFVYQGPLKGVLINYPPYKKIQKLLENIHVY